jgi:hypothetical protein
MKAVLRTYHPQEHLQRIFHLHTKLDLPFGKKAPAAAKPAPVLEGSETQSNDEL